MSLWQPRWSLCQPEPLGSRTETGNLLRSSCSSLASLLQIHLWKPNWMWPKSGNKKPKDVEMRKPVLSPLTTLADVSTVRKAAAGQYQTALKALLNPQYDTVHVCLWVSAYLSENKRNTTSNFCENLTQYSLLVPLKDENTEVIGIKQIHIKNKFQRWNKPPIFLLLCISYCTLPQNIGEISGTSDGIRCKIVFAMTLKHFFSCF